MQETPVWFLVQEDPTCCGATKPVCHNCWACALEPKSHSFWSLRTQYPVLCNKRSHSTEVCPQQLERSPGSPQLEKSSCSNEDPAQTKRKKKKKWITEAYNTGRTNPQWRKRHQWSLWTSSGEVWKEAITNRQEEISSEGDEHVHYTDCSGSFMGIHMPQCQTVHVKYMQLCQLYLSNT